MLVQRASRVLCCAATDSHKTTDSVQDQNVYLLPHPQLVQQLYYHFVCQTLYLASDQAASDLLTPSLPWSP